jgi:SAM-dependent methyltransferase
MKALDYFLRDWRYRLAEPWIPDGSRVLDIGGYDGSLLRRIARRIAVGVCIDPHINDAKEGNLTFVRSNITSVIPYPDASFNVVTMLAVFEHLSANRFSIADEVARVLAAKGTVVLTVPSDKVDHILNLLKAFHLVDGMSAEEHDHFNPYDTAPIFETRGFRLKRHKRFQFGLNNLFVFEKTKTQEIDEDKR